VAFEAQRAQVGEVAFAASFDDRHDVICVPEALAGLRLHSPRRQQPNPRRTALPLDVMPLRHAVDPAKGTEASVAIEHLIA
jgi:hypothetical protein